MSSGGAEVVGELLKIPVAREITLAAIWFFSLQFSIAHGEWGLFFMATIVGALLLGLAWWNHHRKNNKSHGGGKLVFVLLLMIVALPLLLIAWRQRKRRETAHG